MSSALHALLRVLGHQGSFLTLGCVLGTVFPLFDPSPIARFVWYVALPALLFRSMLLLDLSSINVPFLGAMLVAKWAIAAGGMALARATLSGDRLKSCGLCGLLISCSNDLAFGYPLVQALMPTMAAQVVLLSAVQNLCVNPFLFALMDLGAHTQQQRRQARLREHAAGGDGAASGARGAHASGSGACGRLRAGAATSLSRAERSSGAGGGNGGDGGAGSSDGGEGGGETGEDVEWRHHAQPLLHANSASDRVGEREALLRSHAERTAAIAAGARARARAAGRASGSRSPPRARARSCAARALLRWRSLASEFAPVAATAARRVLTNAAIVAVLSGFACNLLARSLRARGAPVAAPHDGSAGAGAGQRAADAASASLPAASLPAASLMAGLPLLASLLLTPLDGVCALLGALFPAAANLHLGLSLCVQPRPPAAPVAGAAAAAGAAGAESGADAACCGARGGALSAAEAEAEAEDAQRKGRKLEQQLPWRPPLWMSLLKLSAMPPLCRALVTAALLAGGRDASAAEPQLFRKLAWLYGALPTAPWIAAFAATYDHHPRVASRTVGVSTACAIPLLALSVHWLFAQQGAHAEGAEGVRAQPATNGLAPGAAAFAVEARSLALAGGAPADAGARAPDGTAHRWAATLALARALQLVAAAFAGAGERAAAMGGPSGWQEWR